MFNTGVVQDFATGAEFITDTDNAPDGSLYWVTVKAFNSAVYKVSYVNTTNRAPTAIATANITADQIHSPLYSVVRRALTQTMIHYSMNGVLRWNNWNWLDN